LALLNSGFLREKEVDMWRATAGDPYPMEKNPDEITMFMRLVERGLALPASNFFKWLLFVREARLRAEHVAFSFMKRRVQSLMARDTLGYQYTGEGDSSRMPDIEIDDDNIINRLGRILKDMPAYTPCPVPEYSAAHPPKGVSSCTECRVLIT
jgi:hypothetical protein